MCIRDSLLPWCLERRVPHGRRLYWPPQKDSARRSEDKYRWKVLPRLSHLANLSTNVVASPWKANWAHHRLWSPRLTFHALFRPDPPGIAEYQTHAKEMEKWLVRQHLDGDYLRRLRLSMRLPIG